MSYVNLKDAPHELAARRPFEGNSMSASYTHTGRYVVYSYSTAIALYDPSDGTLYLNTDDHSVTTVRHKGCLWRLAHDANYVVTVDCQGMRGDGALTKLREAAERYAPTTT